MALNTGDASGTQLTEAILDQYSDVILREGLGANRFEQFAVVREDLLTNPGEVIKFYKFDDLNGDPLLVNESTPITTNAITNSIVSISIDEYAFATSVSEKLLITSVIDVLEEQAIILGRHYSMWGPDKLIREVALDNGGSAVSVKYGGGAASRTALGAGDVLDTDLIRDCVESLQTNNTPKFNNDFYVCIAHPHQLRHLRQDPDWIASNNDHQTGNMFVGQVGRWEDVIFLSTSNLFNGAITDSTAINFLDNGGGSNALRAGVDGNAVDVYQASMFGESFYALAWALPVEMRDDGVTDFGRIHKLAWYALYGAGLLHPTYGFRLETA